MSAPLEFMPLYNDWVTLDAGASAQLRRVSAPDELRDIPAGQTHEHYLTSPRM